MNKLSQLFVALSMNLLIVGQASAVSPGQGTSAKMTLIKELMGLQGQEQGAQEMIKSIIEEQKISRPELKLEFWKEFESSLNKIFNKYQDKMLKIYEAEFSEKTLKDAIAFYKTESGKNLLTAGQKVLMQNQDLLIDLQSEVADFIMDKLASLDDAKGAQKKQAQ